ncbi:NUDIX hydrolase [Saccharothrix deserti]|uniref:NUDIX hydrolase n=1 Tax=Saccharothrix deserti TaxID=2593674 RepID=UPI00131B33BF|nr:NUDIX hydrolase [Saccharothrix deserti]
MTSPESEDDRWIVHSERPIYENEWITVSMADISVPSGERFEHHVVSMKPAAMTAVLDESGENVLLAWRHRFPSDVWNWELPGGLIDGGEDAEQTAIREIAEETGYRPRTVEHLVTFEPMIGMVRNAHHVFLARGAERIGEPTEQNEGRFEWVPLAEIPKLIAQGKILNSGTLVALLHVLAISGHPSASK